ncbi:MAG TPA: envelope stress response membrane protein PspC [Microvirga sp.]|nr:envelope stress response membrane protein PspC [Microvirga sp.]
MSARRTKYYRDKLHGKVAGVCAGIADYTGMSRKAARWTFLILTIVTGPWTILAYLVTMWLAPVKPIELYERSPEEKKFWQDVRSNPRRMARDVRSKFRDLDRRLADMETYVTSSNNSLAREIERLR